MKQKKWLPLVLSLSIGFGGALPAAAAKPAGTVKSGKIHSAVPAAALLKKQISDALVEQGIKSNSSNQEAELLIVTSLNITADLMKAGAKVERVSKSVYKVSIAANKAHTLSTIKGIKAVGRDKMLSLPTPISSKFLTPSGKVAEPNLEYSNKITGMAEFWKQGYDGKNTKIAIIDTGVEPKNELLTLTSDGKLKIIDYQDFWKYSEAYSEGDVILSETEVENSSIFIGDFNLNVPSSVQGKVLAGMFEEGLLVTEGGTNGHDVNNNGKRNDLIPVVVTNYANDTKLDDLVYVDTNSDGSIADEQPLGIYKEVAKNLKNEVIFEMADGKPVLENGAPKVLAPYQEQYKKLVNHFANARRGTNPSGAEYNFVATSVEQRGEEWIVNLGYDGNSHGSHVAGDAAANGYKSLSFVDRTVQADGTLKGAAPGAQIIACRVFQSDGGTPQSSYMAAMEYAAEQGADVANMSLGSLPDINDNSDPTAALIEILGKKYGTIFVISAGNEGPSTNAIGTPGAGEWAITSGAYNPAWINYGNSNVEAGLWYFSSRGPTEDGRLKPTVIAPGSMISSMPMWMSNSIRSKSPGGGNFVGYGLEQGTSMSSPYTAGTVAALLEGMKQNKLPYHPLVVKEALFETGNKNINKKQYHPTEIGGGMVDPAAALNYLKDITAKGLQQSDLTAGQEYIDRFSMIVKSEVNYSEKLAYNPEGLYVRDGDIPETVTVTLTNTKNKDLNLALTKDGYNYQTDWLELPQTNLSLKKGESKTLTLAIKKEKLKDGINSMLIRMDDSSTQLKDGFIPITIINYLDLDVDHSVGVKNSMGLLAPGASSANFIRIPYGTEKVDIDLELTDVTDPSTLIPIVTAPSGIQVADVPGVDWITSLNNKITLTLKKPEAGTWEIDLFSGLINDVVNARGEHKITAKIKGISFGPSVAKYSGKSGEYIEKQLDMKILNATSNDKENIALMKTNLVSLDANKKETEETIQNGEVQNYFFTIPKNDDNIFTHLKTGNPEHTGDDLDIVLYKMVRDANNNLKPSGIVNVSANSGSEESIYYENLPAGEYMLMVEAYQTAPTTKYTLSMQVVNSSMGENVLKLSDQQLLIEKDKISNTKVGLRVPVKSGKYMGFVYTKDSTGTINGKAKILAESTGTENSIAFEMGEIIRHGKGMNLSVIGEIKDPSKLNNMYGIEFEIAYDSSKLTNASIQKGDLFAGTNVKEISKKIEDGKITYAIGFINQDGSLNATGEAMGILAKIRMNAEKAGKVQLNLNKVLLVNYLGDEIAINVIHDYNSFIVNPDLLEDGTVNILDITRMAHKVGKSAGHADYKLEMDLNQDGNIDFKDFNFIVNSFNEDQ